ncbi:MAG: pyridoxamine 5'-phosphate oxidase family protein [Patescibacteria group bacterium]
MDIEKAIREYLLEIIHLSLATCKENRPWVCELHFAYDNDLNFYFRSKPDTRHSIEIASNPNVAGDIVTQHTVEEEPRGVYFEGMAERLLNVDESHPAYTLYCERFGTGPEILEENKTDTGHGFYKITVEKFSLFDSRESSPSQKYELPWTGRTEK